MWISQPCVGRLLEVHEAALRQRVIESRRGVPRVGGRGGGFRTLGYHRGVMRRVPTLVLAMLAVMVLSCRAGELLCYAEDASGEPVASRGAGTPFNPASVIKVGTSWFALERLGVGHRYLTRFGYTGSWDRDTGTVTGDLVVQGGGDPDFQPENAFLVARELGSLGVRKVTGDLVVEGAFWLGWEGGPLRRPADPAVRAVRAGRRLLRALDAGRWGPAQRDAWDQLCTRVGWLGEAAPSVPVGGGVRVGEPSGVHPLVVHRSNPLPVILRRFNVYSNNDIERIADGLGGVPELERFLRGKLGESVRLETACGLGTNRMTAVQVVRMLRGLESWLAARDLGLRDLLPVPGCDPGPIPRMFPMLATGPLGGTVTCKSGTLSDTDGGVAVLAGSFQPARGTEVLFCVAAPGAGGRLKELREREGAWLAGLIRDVGGARAAPCGAPLPYSDTGAVVSSGMASEGRKE